MVFHLITLRKGFSLILELVILAGLSGRLSPLIWICLFLLYPPNSVITDTHGCAWPFTCVLRIWTQVFLLEQMHFIHWLSLQPFVFLPIPLGTTSLSCQLPCVVWNHRNRTVRPYLFNTMVFTYNKHLILSVSMHTSVVNSFSLPKSILLYENTRVCLYASEEYLGYLKIFL